VPVLDVEASSALARRLTGEIASLGSAEAAIEWARQTLGAKNTLTAGDAGSVEAAFRARMLVLEPKVHPLNATSTSEDSPASGRGAQLAPTGPDNSPPDQSRQLAPEPPDGQRPPSTTSRPQSIDKSGLALMEPRRYRNKDHVRFVASQPCTGAAGSRRTRTISDLPSNVHWAARYRMSSQFRCAESTIVSFIARVMKPRGGAA
jgi:hypothetical protein